MAAKVAGCTTIIALDIHDSRLELAKELGATHTINSADTSIVTGALMEATDGEGVNYILDTTGVPAILSNAAKALAKRGTLATVAAAAPGTEVSFEVGESLVTGWKFQTIVQGSSVPQVFIPRLVKL